MFDLFTRSVSCHFRQLPLDNKVIPSFTRQERSQGGQDFFQKCLQWEMMSWDWYTALFIPGRLQPYSVQDWLKMWKISQEELFRGSGGAGAQSPPSVLPGGVMPMTSSWGRLGSVQLARAESRVVLHRCRIGKRSAGILSVKQQMGPEKIETWGTPKKNVFASFCDLLRLSNQCCQFGGYILYMLHNIYPELSQEPPSHMTLAKLQ